MTIAPLGPYSRPHTLAKIDGRRKEAKLLQAMREELTSHVGAPNPVQRALIERCVTLQLQIALMDREVLGKTPRGALSSRQSKEYLAFTNSLRLALAQLGVDEAPATKAKPESLGDYLAGRVAAQ
jgi:hypothetical protein